MHLDSFDFSVFIAAVALANQAPTGDGERDEIEFQEAAMLRRLRLGNGGRDRKMLADSITRLIEATYEFEVPGLCNVQTHLFQKSTRTQLPNGRVMYRIKMDLDIAKVIKKGWSFVNLDERLSLKNPLSQWLHNFYSSHDGRVTIGPSKLQVPAGRQAMRADKWLAALQIALAELKVITGWPVCELDKFGNVAVQRFAKKEALPAAPKAQIKTQTKEDQAATTRGAELLSKIRKKPKPKPALSLDETTDFLLQHHAEHGRLPTMEEAERLLAKWEVCALDVAILEARQALEAKSKPPSKPTFDDVIDDVPGQFLIPKFTALSKFPNEI